MPETIATILAILGSALSVGIPLWFKYKKLKKEENEIVSIANDHPNIDTVRKRLRNKLRKVRAEYEKESKDNI